MFDFLIVISAWFGIVVKYTHGLDVGPVTTIIRSFRIARILKIIKRYSHLRKIFNTFVVAVPALVNVGGLLFLFLYLYAVLGVFLFSAVKF